jgi:hypothetical protein
MYTEYEVESTTRLSYTAEPGVPAFDVILDAAQSPAP